MTEVWLRDFYATRGHHAHGHRKARPAARWSTMEHLLLGTYVFSLLVKCVLAGRGLYTMSKDDVSDMNVFERLACADLFRQVADRHSSLDSPWARIRMEATREAGFKRAVRAAFEKMASEPAGRKPGGKHLP